MTKTNNKGITLIALVITIIVLLILAGVSIAMLTGSNGVLTKAREAEITNVRGTAAEKINVTLNGCITELLSDVTLKDNTHVTLPTKDDVANLNGLNTEDGDNKAGSVGKFTIVVATELPEADDAVITITWKTPDEGKYGADIVGQINYDKSKNNASKGETPFYIKTVASSAMATE